MTDAVKGLSLDEARALFDRFHAMVTAPVDRPADTDELGKLEALAGVREFPVRIKCASLAWHALKAAIADANPGVVKTE
jgi:nitrogen fixation NifU-like protein